MNDEYQNCRLCRLADFRQNMVWGEGNPDAEVMFITGSPSEHDDLKGYPLIGSAGTVYDQMLTSLNLSREEIWTTCTVMCRPMTQEGDRRVARDDELEACRPRVRQEIMSIDPNIIILFGEEPVRMLVKTKRKFSSLVGTMEKITITTPIGFSAEYMALISYSPAQLMLMDASWAMYGPARQATEMIRHAVKVSDFLELLRRDPENALSDTPQLPFRGNPVTVTGQL